MQSFFRLQPYFLVFYLLSLGITLGAVIASGALSAPSIFRAPALVPNLEMTLFQSGILMTSIFVKLNILLNFLAVVILFYEILSFRVSNARIAPLLGLISIVLIFLFTLYYTPYILQAQSLGEEGIANATFDKLHTQSVYVFKALMASLCLLFIVRTLKAINSGYKGK
ncbi:MULTISPECIES: DUF4149 domain-containing protein [Helicobacter]|uniref:DUF4149 domain-containing protein n=1 Tax=Helicobacter ganmani TaxID=60246 RepID=A0A3D8IB97_9HELI|nr:MULTISPECIES: DUF4149 domain-containing protein [Helicobacter]RDU62044.1 DUF4149 domain-containing protein [Helicobacter ganmani]